MNTAFLGNQESRAAPNPNRSQRQRRGNSAAIRNSAGRNDRQRLHRVDDLRYQRKIADGSGVPAGFIALRNNHIGAFARVAERVLHCARQRHHLDSSVVRERHHFGGIAEPDNQNRHFLFENHLQLFAGCLGVLTQLFLSGGCGAKPSFGINSVVNAACFGYFSWISFFTSSGSGTLTSSIFGKVISTPNGRSVSALTRRMRSRITSGRIELPPIQPKPPALETAATSSGGVVIPSLSQPMPA